MWAKWFVEESGYLGVPITVKSVVEAQALLEERGLEDTEMLWNPQQLHIFFKAPEGAPDRILELNKEGSAVIRKPKISATV